MDGKARKILETIDPENYPIDARLNGDVAKIAREQFERGEESFGMAEPAMETSEGVPVPPKASMPALLSGVTETLTFGAVRMPDLPNETPNTRLLRSVGNVIGWGIMDYATLGIGRAVGLGQAGLAAVGAGVEATRMTFDEYDDGLVAGTLQMGITALAFGMLGPKAVAEKSYHAMIRETLPGVKYKPLHKTWERTKMSGVWRLKDKKFVFEERAIKDIPEADKEMVRGFNALHKHITTGEIDFRDFREAVAKARRGEKIPEDYMVQPAEPSALKKIYSDISDDAWRHLTPAAGLEEFHVGSFGKIVAGKRKSRMQHSAKAETVAATAEGVVAGGATTVAGGTIAAALRRMEMARLPGSETAASMQEAVRSSEALRGGVVRLPPDLAGAKPRYAIGRKMYNVDFESDIDKALYIVAQREPSKRDASYLAFLQGHIPNKSVEELRNMGRGIRKMIKSEALAAQGDTVVMPASPLDAMEASAAVGRGLQGGSQASEYIVTPSGQRLTPDEALARRGPPRRAHAYEDVLSARVLSRKAKLEKGGYDRGFTYVDSNTNEPFGTVRLVETPQGEVMIIEFNVAKGWTEAVLLDMRARHGATLLRPTTQGEAGLAYRLGGRNVYKDKTKTGVIDIRNIRSKR